MTRIFVLSIALCFLVSSNVLAGSAVRYALIVGNNHANNTGGIDLEDLVHAEAEAKRIRDQLIRLGNFDPDSGRIVLLQGKTRAEILKAAKRLAEKHKNDKKFLGDLPTLFAFFFTGHGLGGSLLTSGEALTATDLGNIFSNMGATFTIGLFDACFSGQLNLENLRSKGLKVTPGFNAFRELPQEVLHSKGTMWFVSSHPDQVSYEDDRVGGVFTHFFIEAMERARDDGFGITLDEIWEYARRKTQDYTASTGRPQLPQKMVRNLVTSGPLYFSFPEGRSAELVFSPEISGRFLLHYDNGQLTEVIKKKRGRKLIAPVFPGSITLVAIQGGKKKQQIIRLRDGSSVSIRRDKDWRPKNCLGQKEVAIRGKGDKFDGVVLSKNLSKLSLLLSTEYRAAFGSEFSAIPKHNAHVGLRLVRDWFHGSLSLAYGGQTKSFNDWSASVDRVELSLSLGAGLDFSFCRLVGQVDSILFSQDVRYRDGTSFPRGGFGFGLSVSALWPILEKPIPFYLITSLGGLAQYAPPLNINGEEQWRLAPWVNLGIGVWVF